jgi:hypothetical protein
MRFAVQLLFFDNTDLVLRAIANIAPHVERIYVSYSRLPWAYNRSAREDYVNLADVAILRESPHYEKITVVKGDWISEEAQRNASLEKAREAGFDYLIVQDPDEFYLPEEIEKNLEAIRQNPGFHYYRNPWLLFWKTTKYVLVHRAVRTSPGGQEITERNVTHNYSMAFALNLRKGTRFQRKRFPTCEKDFMILPGVCHHLSWVYNDEQLLRKLFTWGHTNDVYDKMLWYRAKWLGWNPAVRNLHPINGIGYTRAVLYHGRLPAEIADFDPGEQRYIPASTRDVLSVKAHEAFARLRITVQAARRGLHRTQARFRRSGIARREI